MWNQKVYSLAIGVKLTPAHDGLGVINAVTELEELARIKYNDESIKFTKGNKIWLTDKENEGVNAYVSTSSAGGCLQMMVTGVVAKMTGESAERAALGAGAIVMDLIASNDKRANHDKIERINYEVEIVSR